MSAVSSGKTLGDWSMRRQVSLIGLGSLLTLFLGGCLIGNEEQQASNNTPSPSPLARQSPLPSPANFPSPLTSKQPGSPAAVAGLIQSLPAEARIKQIPTGRSDPFAAIPVQPEVTVSSNSEGGGETGTQPVPQIPRIPGPVRQPVKPPTPSGGSGGIATRNPRTQPKAVRAKPPAAKSSKLPSPKPSTAPKRVLPRPPRSISKPQVPNRLPARPTPPLGLPPVATAPSLIPQFPPLPEPTLAKGIEITGVVDVAGVLKAIVKVPNEPSRSVREGDRLSNGQVLVKRIDMNQGPTPVVVLEQFGIEVAKRVGEGGAPGQTGSPTASLPAPPPGNTDAVPQA